MNPVGVPFLLATYDQDGILPCRCGGYFAFVQAVGVFSMRRIILFSTALVLLTASYCLAGSEAAVSGTYVNKADKEYLTLNPDGTLHLKIRKKPTNLDNPFLDLIGKYRMTGEDITFELEGGGEASGKIKGNTFTDNEGKTWIKEGTSEPPQMEQSPKKGLRMRQ
jgi:hypothetical protein